MTSTTKLFDLGELAEAAYADFTNFNESTSASTIKTALIAKGFSEAQATEFVANWRVVSHQPDTASSYSGTLFEYIGNDPNSGFANGELVFAQRGTQGAFDIAEADLHEIATNGLAFRQIIDVYNYWQRLTAANGATVHEARLVLANPLSTPSNQIITEDLPILPDVYWTIEFEDVASAGLGKANINQLADVVGHSLGGHLAAAFTRLFGAESTTINGAGYATGLLPGLGLTAGSNIPNLFSMLGGFAVFPTNSIHNIFGEEMPEIITMDSILGLKQQGSHDSLFIEQPAFYENLFGHGSSQMVDSLAVANLFIKLDSSFATQTPAQALSILNELFEKSSNQAAQSLEKLVEGLSEFILGNKPTITTDDRNSLYTAINNLTDSATFQALIGKVSIVSPPTSASEARSDLGLFLSLYYLTPFALKTDGSITADAQFTIANPDIATQFKEDKLLTSKQITNGEANFSDLYLNDRAAMPSWIVKRNAGDTSGIMQSEGQIQLFSDVATDTLILTGSGPLDRSQYVFGADSGNSINDNLSGSTKADHLYGMAGNDTLNGGDGDDYLEGGADDDKLNGGDDNDWLYGGAGADELTGGKGIDQLKGGAGADQYIHNDGDGNDVIVDSDGLGSIQVKAGATLNGGKQVKGTDYVWESADHKTFYTKFDQGDGTFTLNITLENKEKIFVKDWQDGNLGISLQDSTPATVAVLTNTSDMYFAKDADEQIDGGEGNDVLFGTTREKFTLKGGIGNDLILGYGNSPPLALRADIPDASGTYNSVGLYPISSTDHTSDKWQTVNGEWHLDASVMGSDQYVYLYGSAYIGSLWTITGVDPQYGNLSLHNSTLDLNLYTYAAAPTDTPAKTEITEVLEGGAGDDLISGSMDADYIVGGNDNDILYGNAGDDFMFGGQAANGDEWRVAA